MKNSPALKGFIISFAAVLVAFGIYFVFLAKKNYYVVDNPTSSTYYFKINNGTESIISGGQTVEVSLKKGANRIAVYDANKKALYDSAFNVDKIRGLLNIANQDYYVNTQYYGYNLNKDSLLTALGTTTIDGQPYYGGAKKMNKLYTEDFYYNVNEDYDQLIKNIDKVESRSKIFRKQDYINYYKEYYKF